MVWINLLTCSIAHHSSYQMCGILGVHILWGKACQRALLGMEDLALASRALPWDNFVFYQGYLIPLPRSHFIFSHEFWCREWHIGTLAVHWPWSHALWKDCFIPFLCLVPSGVALKCGFFFFFFNPGLSRNRDPGPYDCGLVYWAWFTIVVLG